jgi:fucose 4-O-acetylase-like acetyltransferase
VEISTAAVLNIFMRQWFKSSMQRFAAWSLAAGTICVCLSAEHSLVSIEVDVSNTPSADSCTMLQLHTGTRSVDTGTADVETEKRATEKHSSDKAVKGIDTGIVYENTMRISAWCGLLSVFLGSIIASVVVRLQNRDGDEEGTQGRTDDPSKQHDTLVRSSQLDFAKFWLICMVTAVHMPMMSTVSTVGQEFTAQAAVINFFNPFGTRTFALISGISSRRPKPMKDVCKSVLIDLVLPSLAYCFFICPLGYKAASGAWIDGSTWIGSGYYVLVNTWGTIWYMFALIFFRLYGEILRPLPKAYRLGVAVALAALGGYCEVGQGMAFGMAMSTLPLFVVGQILPWEAIVVQFPSSLRAHVLGFVLMLLLFGLTTFEILPSNPKDIPAFGWTGKNGNWIDKGSRADPFFWLRGQFRNVLELIKGLIFILLCCPQSSNIFSDLGRHTMYPFLLQAIAIPFYNLLGLEIGDWAAKSLLGIGFRLVLWICIAFLISAALSSWPVRLVFRPLFEPRSLMQFVEKDKLVT